MRWFDIADVPFKEFMMTRLFAAVAAAALVLAPAASFAQTGANAYTDAVKAQLAMIK
jgi:hypothetical protein